MADTFRIVTIGDDGRARVLEDLQVADSIYRERDTLAITPGAGRARTAASSARWAGEQTTGEVRGNAGIGATLAVKGTNAAAAGRTVERLLERVSSARRDLFIEWRPEGLTQSVYSRITGPGSSSPAYRALEWQGARRMAVPVAWPVEPLPRGLPCSVYEKFEPPSDKPGGLVNALLDPNGALTGNVWGNFASSSTTLTTIDPTPSSPDVELDGRGRYLGMTPSGGGLGGWVWALTASGPYDMKGAVVAGAYYAVRCRIKVRTAFTNAPAGKFTLDGTWTGGATTFSATLTTSPANTGTYAVGDVIDLAVIVQAPALATALELELLWPTNSTTAGAIKFGRFMITRVAGPTSAIPAYFDGESPNGRHVGAPFLSPIAELSESKLADYVRPASSAAPIERVSQAGLWQRFQTGFGGLLAHTSRAPVPDGEVLIGAYLHTPVTADNSHAGFISPGIRYSPDDGAYIYATIEGTQMRLWIFTGTPGIDIALTSPTTVTDAPSWGSGRAYYMTLRAEGDQITAEWYGTTVPNLDRGNYNTRIRATLTAAQAASYGRDRLGYPMLRAKTMLTGATVQTTRFEYRTYMTTQQRLPETVALRKLPGTAPALLSPAIAFPGGGPGIAAGMDSGDHLFGLFSWRNKRGRENLARNGDGTRRGGFTAIAGGTYTEDYGTGPAGGAEAPLELARSGRISANAAGTNSGGTVFETRRTFRRGTPYTLEFFAYAQGAIGTLWTIDRLDTILSSGSTVATNIITGLADSQPWSRYVMTFRPDVELSGVALRVIHPASGAGGREVLIAGYRLYEGTPADAPLEREHTNGRGGAAPFGVLQAENTIDIVGTLSTADSAQLHNGQAIKVTSAGSAVTTNLDYWIDPRLILPADFAGDTVDVQVFASAVLDANIANPFIVASARHEADVEGGARVYTREFGSAGRLLSPQTTASKKANTVLLGTLTLGTRGGRYALRAGVNPGAVNATGIALDELILVPLASTASSPTGKPLSFYPTFAPWVWSSASGSFTISHERYVEPDGSARTILPDGTTYPYGSIGGERMELDPAGGDAELLAWVYPAAPSSPDNPGLTGWTAKGPQATIRVDVTPRYRLLAA